MMHYSIVTVLVVQQTLLPFYHFFFSYRWGVDDALVTQTSDALLEEVFGTRNMTVICFQDRKRLTLGNNFLAEFVTALEKSLIVVVTFTRFALDRMNTVSLEDGKKKSHDYEREVSKLISFKIIFSIF